MTQNIFQIIVELTETVNPGPIYAKGIVPLWAIVFVVPVWRVFASPRWGSAWPFFLRILLAVLCAQAVVYGIFYGLIYPVVDTYAWAHPVCILDGITLFPPYFFCMPATVISLLLWGVRASILAIRPFAKTH
jgi:hypothetical protein